MMHEVPVVMMYLLYIKEEELINDSNQSEFSLYSVRFSGYSVLWIIKGKYEKL